MFWDNAAAEQLLEERYPWFLDTWRMYPRVVHRGGEPLQSTGLSQPVIITALLQGSRRVAPDHPHVNHTGGACMEALYADINGVLQIMQLSAREASALMGM